MTCCAPTPEFAEALAGGPNRGPSLNEVRLASRDLGQGLRQSEFSVPAIHCGACIRTIETALDAMDGVASSRVNLSSKRVTVRWHDDGTTTPPIVRRLVDLGYEPNLFSLAEAGKDAGLAALVRALAVAAFCSMNIMMFSGSVWSGANGPTRNLLHWICAALTMPALLYSGRVFYQSAWSALRAGRTNMDVPITIGIALAFALSFYDTVFSGDRVYYDAVASLIFFLLIGRTLDHAMRERARTAVKGLARLAPAGALVLDGATGPAFLPLGDIAPGSSVSVGPGERIPLDGEVTSGTSALDRSMLTGESLAEAVGPGQPVPAGALNISGHLVIRTTATEADFSTLNRLVQLLDDAEASRNRYRRIADRAAGWYSPVVHLAAALGFAGWMIFAGNLHDATTVAIAVLIITCPCALGLAVPMVQVMAARRLFEAGIMVRDGAALERLAEVDTVVFDKTGTLTTGLARPVVAFGQPEAVGIAASLAALSRHPYSLAIAHAFPMTGIDWQDVIEHPGLGIEARLGDRLYRLGRPGWSGQAQSEDAGSILSSDGIAIAAFSFKDDLRPYAALSVSSLLANSLQVLVLSGDLQSRVENLAGHLGISGKGTLLPAQKLAEIETFAARGQRVLVVGDGLNDTPAMARAHVSMAPASAIDISRNAADFVFLRNDLTAVPRAIGVAREARKLVRQNLFLAMLYNAIALPIAMAGLVNPFLAAVAMSASSVVVVLNALRLGWHPFSSRSGDDLHA